MITLTSNKASVPIQVRCTESISTQGQWLADTVASFDGTGSGLVDGASFEIGWSNFLLRKQPDGSLLVCEPDFTSDPFKAVSEDVSRSLTVLTAQIDLLRVVDLKAEPCRFDQTLVVRKGTLEQRHVFARRQQPSRSDSGWYLGPTDSPFGKPAAADLEEMPLYSLMNRRPQILLALALPVGCMVVWDGPAISTLLNPEGRNLWHTTN
ncbi:MAG: hypothetical protein WDO72_05150 [Pseudomonadota bacterium]